MGSIAGRKRKQECGGGRLATTAAAGAPPSILGSATRPDNRRDSAETASRCCVFYEAILGNRGRKKIKKKVKKGSRAAGAVGESIPCIATLHQADEARDALRLKLSLKRSAACGIEQ